MAVTVLIRGGCPSRDTPRPGAAAEPLRLTLDAPRLVIGRGKSCDIQLPDCSVSLRHASIRHDGGRPVVFDEGSTNGVAIIGPRSATAIRLSPQTPHPLAEGDFVRVGRVWLEVSFAAAMPSSTADVRAAARELMRRSLMEAGEPACAFVELGSKRLELADVEREYIVGRAADCDLVLDDELASRRHAALCRDGSSWKLRDLSSSRGTVLGAEPVPKGGAKLADDVSFTIGTSVIAYRDPLEHALDESRTASDVKMRTEELATLPPGRKQPTVEPPPEEAQPDPTPVVDEEDQLGTMDRLAEEPPSTGFAAVDALVFLVALGLLGMSVFGLAYVLG